MAVALREVLAVLGMVDVAGVTEAHVPFSGELGMTIGGAVDHGPYRSKFITATK